MTSVVSPTTNGHPRTGTAAGNVAAGRAALDVIMADAAASQGRTSRQLRADTGQERSPLLGPCLARELDVPPGTVTKRASWWPDYIEWLSRRSGALKPAPTTLGNRQYKAQAKTPGSCVQAA
ncbi:MAG TPA: hypothetical protein VGF91_26725 [Solirubrobacteraceae bacterium]